MVKNNQEIKKIFSERLKYYRKLKGLNQTQLAKMVGVKANTISNYERAHSLPDPFCLDKIIKHLDISRDDLFVADAQEVPAREHSTSSHQRSHLLDLLEIIEGQWDGDPDKIGKLKSEIIRLYERLSDAENKVIGLFEDLRKIQRF